MTNAAQPYKFTPVALTTPLARLADLILDGALEANLRAWRQSGMSWDDVAKHLWIETDRQVSITGAGIQRWARDLGIDDAPPRQEQTA